MSRVNQLKCDNYFHFISEVGHFCRPFHLAFTSNTHEKNIWKTFPFLGTHTLQKLLKHVWIRDYWIYPNVNRHVEIVLQFCKFYMYKANWCLSACLPVCLSVCLSTCLYVCRYVCMHEICVHKVCAKRCCGLLFLPTTKVYWLINMP